MRQKLFAVGVFGLAALLLMLPSAVRAQKLDFAFDSSAQSGVAGSSLIFTGTVTNNTGQIIDLTFDALSLSPSSVATADDTVFQTTITDNFINGTPVTLANGASLSVGTFSVLVSASAAPGSVASGLFSVQATDDATQTASFTTSDVPFSVNVATAVPEPRSVALSGAEMIAVVLFSMRRRAARR